jgi:hypothetical protein
MVDGKRHSIYGRTQSEVRKKLTEVSITIDHGDYLEDSGLTLGQWMQMWHRDFLGNVKLGTADSYEMQMRVHIIPTLGNIKLSALKTPMIQRLYNKKLEEGLSPKCILRMPTAGFAEQNGRIAELKRPECGGQTAG